MRLHRLLIVASLLGGSVASAQSVLDRPKTADAARAKKDQAPHVPLFLEQKDLPAMSKTAMREPVAPRLSSKSKD